jgi:hypothetical protein
MIFLKSQSEFDSQPDHLNPYRSYEVKEEKKKREPLIDFPIFFLAFIPLYAPILFMFVLYILQIFSLM